MKISASVAFRVGSGVSSSAPFEINLAVVAPQASSAGSGRDAAECGQRVSECGKGGELALLVPVPSPVSFPRVAPGLSTRSLATLTLCPHGDRPWGVCLEASAVLTRNARA